MSLRRRVGHRILIILSSLAFLPGLGASCVTNPHVHDKQVELTGFLDGVDVRARLCAPRELAEARSNLEFAIYEAGEGQTTRAFMHMELAERRARQAWERSRGEECEPDSDLDGVRDSKDKCPTEAEDYDGDRDDDGCPDADMDGDGLDDDHDRCPAVAEDKDGYQDDDGCPDIDNDGDGIRDDLDQCPMKPEDRDGHEDIDGCPDPDNDGDGLLDINDKCPMQAEDFDGDSDEDGCPDLYKKIIVTKTRIELKQKVYFKSGKAKIQRKSFDMLGEIADVLIRNPNLSVRIEGHTDSKGSAKYNRNLSQSRAESVKKFLERAGVEGARMIAVGYGEDVPIDTNETREGREKNRRVEFHIIR